MNVPYDWFMQDGEPVRILTKPHRFVWTWELQVRRDGIWDKPVGRGMNGWAMSHVRASHKARRRVNFLCQSRHTTGYVEHV